MFFLLWCPVGLPSACKNWKLAKHLARDGFTLWFSFFWGFHLVISALLALDSVLWCFKCSATHSEHSCERTSNSQTWLHVDLSEDFFQVSDFSPCLWFFLSICSSGPQHFALWICYSYSFCAIRKLWVSSCFPNSELWYLEPLAGKALVFPATIFPAIILAP